MEKFESYLKSTKEIGYVARTQRSIVHVVGLPNAHLSELVIFENDQIGQVLSLTSEFAEVLVLTSESMKVGAKVARTDTVSSVAIGDYLLGNMVDPLGRTYGQKQVVKKNSSTHEIDGVVPTIQDRKPVSQPFVTGISWVDLVVPLSRGQRELVVGDRKVGKTPFLMHVIASQAKQGTVCIYAAIGKNRIDIKDAYEYFNKNGVLNQTIVVAASSSDPIGLIYLAPYTAMTIAEYFRDQGKHVLLVLDDMTAHAKYYREISLLLRRFPGRSAYPGDIFYLHSRLVERAGNFVKTIKKEDGTLNRIESSITCLPVAELVMSDLSGYIQTNLMSMTDGHLYFDRELFNQGRRPAINPYLSVTRVGHQTQSPLMRDISREVTSFLVQADKLTQYIHFGAELSEATRKVLSQYERVQAFLEQQEQEIAETIPLAVNALMIAAIWGGSWKDQNPSILKADKAKITQRYSTESAYKNTVDAMIQKCSTLSELVTAVKTRTAELF